MSIKEKWQEKKLNGKKVNIPATVENFLFLGIDTATCKISLHCSNALFVIWTRNYPPTKVGYSTI